MTDQSQNRADLEPHPIKAINAARAGVKEVKAAHKDPVKQAKDVYSQALAAADYYAVKDAVEQSGAPQIRAEFAEVAQYLANTNVEIKDKIKVVRHALKELNKTLKQAEKVANKKIKELDKEETFLSKINVILDADTDDDLTGSDLVEAISEAKKQEPAVLAFYRLRERADRYAQTLDELSETHTSNLDKRDAAFASRQDKLASLYEEIENTRINGVHEAYQTLAGTLASRDEDVKAARKEGRAGVLKETRDAIVLDFYRSQADVQYLGKKTKGACVGLYEGAKAACAALASAFKGHVSEADAAELSGEIKAAALLADRAKNQQASQAPEAPGLGA